MSKMGPKCAQPRICIIGAGFSGVCAAIQLKRKLGIDNARIYEENHDVGGTWLVNSYPGCASDVMSHLYNLSFEPNPDWSHTYCSGAEILSYLKGIVKKHDIYRNIDFNTQVRELNWTEDSQQWKVTVFHKGIKGGLLRTSYYDIVINGSGVLRIPNHPPEFMKFKGPIIHSAQWDKNVRLHGKIVGIIGSGSSAVQMIPEIAKIAKMVHTYQRTPAWVHPRLQCEIPALIKFLFAALPLLLSGVRILLYFIYEIIFGITVKKSLIHYIGKMMSVVFSRHKLQGRKYLEKSLRPNYSFACKRVCISENYFSTFLKPNVKLHRKLITQVTEDSIETEDGIEKIDVLILATGFKTNDYFSPMEITGVKQENILQTWKNGCPSAYFGIITKSAPNMFILLGPNTILTNSSVLIILECQVNYTIKVIEKMIKFGYKSVCARSQFEESYMMRLKTKMKQKIWTTNCNSWYKMDSGEVTLLMPWSTFSYWWNTRRVNFNHLQFN